MHCPGSAALRVLAVATFAIALVSSPVLAQSESGQQREAPEVRELVLNGVHAVSRLNLEQSIATTRSTCKSVLWTPVCWISRSPTVWNKYYLDHTELRRDVLRLKVFYWKRGYRQTTVDTSVVKLRPNQVRVVFNIVEGPPTVIAAMKVDYDSTLIPARLVRRMTTLATGDPLNLIVLDSMRLNLQVAMWDRGHGDAQVDTIIALDTARRRANVTVRINPRWITTVGTITVRGNEEVSARTIQNSIMLRPGGIFRYVDLTESQRNLYESNLFRLALLSVPPRPDSVKDIDIDVRETKLRDARISGGFNTVDYIQLDGNYTHHNLFGGARRLEVTAILGNLGAQPLSNSLFQQIEPDFSDPGVFQQPTWQVSADLKQPAWLGKPENTLALGAFTHRRATPAVYIDRGYGGQLSYTRMLAPRAPASVTYRFEVTRVEAGDVYYCINYGICDNPTIETLRLHQTLSPLAPSFSIDRTDIPFSPTKGYMATVNLESATSWTGSDFRYNRAYAEASAYTHFRYPSRDPRSQVLAGHIAFGWVRALTSANTGLDLLHPRKRFYAGGSHSVRGYDENQLGPRILTIPPDVLARTGCNVTIASVAGCDPNSDSLRTRDFTPRPTGGVSLLEGSVEVRVPFGQKMVWAAFIDAGVVGSSHLENFLDVNQVVRGAAAITPGFGIRYKSPVGPIRADLGYNPRQVEELTVVTTAPDSTGRQRMVPLRIKRNFTNGGTARGFWSIFNQLVLHLSIGEAF